MGCSARARWASAWEGASRSRLALAHAQHSPGAVVSLLAPAPVTSEKRLREGHEARADGTPWTQVRSSCRVRRGSLGVQEAIPRGAAGGRAVAASLATGKASLQQPIVCSIAGQECMCMCMCIHASGVIGTVETTRFRRTNSYVQPIMWWRAAGGGARKGGAICSRLHGFRSFVQNRKVSTKTEVLCVWALGGGKMAQKFDLEIATE